MPNETNIVLSSGKELSTGTTTAALIEGLLHGWHGVLVVLFVGGSVVAILIHNLERKHREKLNQRRVRDYGIIRIY